ncbi:MAG: acyltransferase family protein, partial [Ruminococcus sp.]|nr:acyltransferase family protein [Ruminococcus sp.]
MDVKRLESRNTSLDIVRIVAVFLVNSVHFFLYNGFYDEIVGDNVPMFIMSIMRTFFTTCVPLFMILTGYLMCNKTLSKSYYKGIRRTLVVYGVATLACMIYKTIVLSNDISLGKIVLDFLGFKGATYSWYIEMYIGLFLIAPFLNLMYNGLNTQRQKQILVFTFFAVTVLPNIFDIHNFQNPQWWANPALSEEYDKLMPNWWSMTYPVAYYLVGAYLREFGMKIKTRTLLIGFVTILLLFSTYNIYRNYGSTYKYGYLINWGNFETYVLTCALFVLLSRIPTQNMNVKAKWCLWKLSDLALGTYLISYIFDRTVYYDFLNKNIETVNDKLPYYLLVVPIIFVLSNIASIIINAVATYAIAVYEAIVKFVKKQRARDDKEKWRDYIFIGLLAAAITFAIWKCFYGFGGNDEAFYLTIPQRYILGDSLFTQEWHLSQMSSVFLLPFTAIYHAIVGSFDGVILAARIVYVIFHAAVATVAYARLRKYGYITVFATLFFFIYTPYDIMAYSYNTMAIDFVVLTGVLMGTADLEHKAVLILGGLCFAGSVLCSPYIAIGYAIYIVCVILHQLLKKRESKLALSSELFSLKTFIWFTVGIVALALVFLIIVLSRTGLNRIFDVLPRLLSDPEHPQISVMDKLRMYFQYTFNFHPQFKLAVIGYGIMALVMFFDKKRKLHRSMYLIVTAAIVLFTYALIFPTLTTSSYNYVMYPMLFIGITSYVLCDEKPKELFVSLFCLGILYSFAVCFSSNQYFYVISMAMCTSNVAS